MTELSKIDSTTQEIIDEFAFFDDWMQRYEYIIEMGKALEGLPDDKKTTPTRYRAASRKCGSTLARQNGRIQFDADSDAMIVQGLIALLLRVYSDRTPDEIISTPPEFFEALELGSHLSGSRAGLHIVTRIHAYAKAFRDELSADDRAGDTRLMERRSFTWKDGIWVEGNQPMLGPMSHAWWMASSVFDGARSFQQLAPDLDRHCARLIESGKAFHMTCPISTDEMIALAWEGIEKFSEVDELYIRPMMYFEDGFIVPDTDSTQFILTVFKAPMPAWGGVKAMVSSYRRPTPEAAPTNAKASCLYQCRACTRRGPSKRLRHRRGAGRHWECG